jgi:alkanesulfonate monooxygenase SsuD/methylene tetrahydromethanopterin reductase-like flavin-dependent oxidoreductase (luciferase family)
MTPGPLVILPRQQGQVPPEQPGGTEDPKGFTPQGRIATNWFVAPLSARARQLTP